MELQAGGMGEKLSRTCPHRLSRDWTHQSTGRDGGDPALSANLDRP